MRAYGTDTIDYLIIAMYLLVVVGVGFMFSKRHETTENYLLGGRNMPYCAVGLSMMMTLLSSISIVRIPGEIFNHGWTLFALVVPSLLLQIPAYLLFTRFYFKLGSFTPYEYLEYRYDAKVRALIAISAFYSRVLYLGMVLYTTSKIFEGAYGWPGWVTILLVGTIGVFYTVLGGMKAVVWTDVIQFFVLAAGLVALVWQLNALNPGGIFETVTYAHRHGHLVPEYATREFYHFSPYIRLCFWLMLWNALIGPIAGVSTDQMNVQRILATRDWKAGFKSQIISTLLGAFVVLILYLIGFAVFAYYTENPDPFVSERGGDVALFRFVSTRLPQPFPAIFMAAMLAAIMSTLDSGINSLATVYLKEIHQKFFNCGISDAKQVVISKRATLAVGVFAVMLGLAIDSAGRWLNQSVSEVGTLFEVLAACAFPAFLSAVLTRRANSKLIWAFTFFNFGEAIGKNIWFALSRASVLAYREDPACGFGWAGKIGSVAVLLPLGIGVLMILPYLKRCWRQTRWGQFSALAGLLVLGYANSMLLWYVFSNALITTEPLARSFAFFLPSSLIMVFIIVWFCPVQPEHKWRGLTLSTINDEIAAGQGGTAEN